MEKKIKLNFYFYTSLWWETLAQEFSCEFCETFKNTFSYRTPPVVASQNFKRDKNFFQQFFKRYVKPKIFFSVKGILNKVIY